MNIFERLFFRLTARRWNALISSTLCQTKEAGIINSRQLCDLAHEFDPTQNGRVGRIVSGGTNAGLASAVIQRGRV